ncbi:2,4-diaminobutyric acid acetyltransferase [Marinomonas ushuaiensis DSM 15871]|uniref:L-2,4-diaminobutyric acid acetyltransferase n=1 Tax=Marinomonas ushuaiensis DSM 15871 TaxID=1122207 RepID=X7E450_9GAMM|nr:diaminobutyrate acetyltransferase [Marinomonas ushuaiensis]ETX10660.1 2,4-diaminobutyric acid acetyltransferase [Marinomonas ushuaiensis DSM 15871]
MSAEKITFNKPSSIDGMAVHQLVASCPPLDTNSVYCNLLQASHFDETSIAASLEDGELVGFVSGYILPNKVDTLFVWQVAVSEKARGQGLAKKMVSQLLERSICSNVHYIETSITQSNQGSWALFRSLAEQLGTSLEESIMFDKQQHFQNKHDTEFLVRIGPFSVNS